MNCIPNHRNQKLSKINYSLHTPSNCYPIKFFIWLLLELYAWHAQSKMLKCFGTMGNFRKSQLVQQIYVNVLINATCFGLVVG